MTTAPARCMGRQSEERARRQLLSQADADSCCAASERDDSTPSSSASLPLVSRCPAACPVSVAVPSTTAPVDAWRTFVPLSGSPVPKHLFLSVFRISATEQSSHVCSAPRRVTKTTAHVRVRRGGVSWLPPSLWKATSFGEAGMINKLIELSLRNRFLVVAAFVGLGGVGLVGAHGRRRSTRSPISPTTRSSSSPTGPGTARRRSKTRSPTR